MQDLPVAERLRLDVTDQRSVDEAVAAAGEIDVLVSNAGVIFVGAVEASPIAEIERLFAQNTSGAIRVAQAVLPQMRNRRSGRLLFVSSVVGRMVFSGNAAYSATKWALEALGEALAIETAPFGYPHHPAGARFGELRGTGRPADLSAVGRPLHPACHRQHGPFRRHGSRGGSPGCRRTQRNWTLPRCGCRSASSPPPFSRLARPRPRTFPSWSAEMKPVMNRRIAVTGLGVVTPGGIGQQAFWTSLLSDVKPEAVRRVDPDRLPTGLLLTHKTARNSDPNVAYAVVSADEALRDAGLLMPHPRESGPATTDKQQLIGSIDPDRAAVSIGTGIGGISTYTAQSDIRAARGERFVSPFTVPMVMPNAAAGALSIRFGMRGPASTITTACAAGTDAIAAGARLIAQGRADLVLAGGTDSSLTAVCIAGFANMRALSRTGISRPFDSARDGFAASEGSGILVLEPYETAVERGAHIYMTIEGAASTADAHHVTAPAPHGAGAERTMRLALEDAELPADAIGHVNAHGTSTGLNDAAESEALSRVFTSSSPGRPPPSKA